jgi:hypothetical protein
MMSGHRAGLALLWISVFAAPVLTATPERSVSTSRQFLVYGTDAQLRGVICDLAERTKRDLLKLVDQRDEWATPIIVLAQYPQANLPECPRAALNVAQTGFGLKLQLELTIASDVSLPGVRRELLRALLIEMMYRSRTSLPAGTACVPPPDWLLDGIPPEQGEVEGRRLSAILSAPVTARKILSLETFLRLRKFSDLDGPGRSLCGAYSFALVDLLTHTPDGRRRLSRFIVDIPSASDDPMASLGTHFPELSDANRAEKAWSLHLARLALSQPFQVLSAEETEKKLNELLIVSFSDGVEERKYRLDEFAKFIRHAAAKVALTQCARDLSLFATHANPIYRLVIGDYARIATGLAQGRRNGMAERLARLSAAREALVTTVEAIDDYLNWFEATKSLHPSGVFADYLRAAEWTTAPERRKRDPISVYLDVLEAEFQN